MCGGCKNAVKIAKNRMVDAIEIDVFESPETKCRNAAT
jgi:DNA polymerase III gamma/tau subunit